MKKLYYLLAGLAIVIVTIAACEKSSIESDELQTSQDVEIRLKTDKVRLCHSDATGGYITNPISQKAAQAHLNHGDRYVYSPKEEWAIIKTNTSNGVVRYFDVNVDSFDGTNFSGTGTYYWNTAPQWDPPNLIPTSLRVWGTVDNTNGDMDISLEWDYSNVTGNPSSKITFNFGGTSCMCSGINEVHEYGGNQQFRLDQPLETCVTY